MSCGSRARGSRRPMGSPVPGKLFPLVRQRAGKYIPMIYALVVLVRNIRTAVKIKTNSHHNKRQTKVHGLPFVTYYNLMFLNKSPRLVPMLSDLGMTTFSSGSSLTTSSRAFMLRLILPSLMPITCSIRTIFGK